MLVFLHYLRALAAIMVVMDHVPNKAVPGSIDWYIIHILKDFSISAVPIFLMASGLLLLNPQKQFNLKEFYKKRLLRIGPAIIFWTFALVRLPYVAIKVYPGTKQLFIDIFHGRPVTHLWYLYMIVSLYFFTPFFRKVIKNCSKQELVLLTVSINIFILIKVAIGVPPGFFLFEFLDYIGYFFLGYLLFQYMESQHIKHRWALLSVLIISLSVVTMLGVNNIDILLLSRFRLSLPVVLISGSLFVFFMSYEHAFKKSNIIKTIDGLGLGIYIIHPVFVKFFLFTYPVVKVDSVGKFLLITAGGWFLALLSAFIIRKIPYFRTTV